MLLLWIRSAGFLLFGLNWYARRFLLGQVPLLEQFWLDFGFLFGSRGFLWLWGHLDLVLVGGLLIFYVAKFGKFGLADSFGFGEGFLLGRGKIGVWLSFCFWHWLDSECNKVIKLGFDGNGGKMSQTIKWINCSGVHKWVNLTRNVINFNIEVFNKIPELINYLN